VFSLCSIMEHSLHLAIYILPSGLATNYVHGNFVAHVSWKFFSIPIQSWSQIVAHNNPQLLISQLHDLKKMLHFNMLPTKSHAFMCKKWTPSRTFTPSSNGILLITLKGKTMVMHKEEQVEERSCIKQRWKKVVTLSVTITLICKITPCDVAYWQTPPLGYALSGNIEICTIVFVGDGS
jgi:hypothetical protein